MPKMPNLGSLTVKMGLALLFVSVVGVAIVALMVSTSTTSEFEHYLGHTQRMRGMMGGAMGEVMRGMMGTSELDFLRRVNRSLWIAGASAVTVALILSLLIARYLVAPLRNLTRTARQIAAGDLSGQVPVTSKDEIGELASSFNSMAQALAQNEEMRRSMVADIAHELRTPLSVLQGNVEAMQDGMLEATPQNLATIHEETLLLSRLVDDLSTLSLAEAGQLKLHPEATDMGELIQRLAASAQPQAQKKGISLRVSLPPHLPQALADADRSAQVLRNLLSNALRYTPEGGSIEVEARPHEGFLLISVADTGPGIPLGDLPHVFDRFYRVDRSRSRASGGAGIGLAIVKQLVEAQGGRAWAESRPGQGSTFRFTVPVAPGQ
jgi:two-component system OmpR family sensor kinase